MLSFFAKKKPILENPSEQLPPIQGPTEDTNNGDEFIFVERKNPVNPQPNTLPIYPPMYPPMPNAPGSYRAPYPSPKSVTDSCPVHYMQGVPFVLSPKLAQDQVAGTSTEIDRILAILTRQMSVDEEINDYDFTLEKSVLNTM